jgi:uncharacterized protein YciW
MSTITALLGLHKGTPLAALLGQRQKIMDLTEASGEAVLAPRAPGGLPHGLRALVALRAAMAVGDDDLVGLYRARLQACADAAAYAGLAAPDAVPDDARLAALLRHADLLARDPRHATRADIERLKAAGVAEDDIVRLAELCAFLAYQARLVAGLRLLKGRA